MRLFALAAVALVASAALFGQEFRGTFSGRVTDAQGAVVVKARVTATEKATGNQSETLTSETGDYTIPFLTPGDYRIAAEMQGFKAFEREGLTLSVGEHPVVDIKLEVATANQSVLVTAAAPMIESANASVGQVVSSAEVDDVPMNGRTALMVTRFASQFNNLRRDPTKNAGLSLLKKVQLRERMYLQFRCEGFNITNRVTFAAPVVSPTNASFGEITSQANTPRRIQSGIRLVW